jgi:hypothetical protein
MSTVPAFDVIEGKPLTLEQKTYLNGFFSGIASKGITFGDLAGTLAPAGTTDDTPLIYEERIKKEEHPLESYYRLAENAVTNKAPDKEETFRFKWNGLFYLNPVKDSFMARLRIPGGQLKSFQLREIAAIAKELTTGYLQITTRANLQIRLIQPKDAPEFLRRIQAIGLHTRGSGADNIRNLTSNPTAGIAPGVLRPAPQIQYRLRRRRIDRLGGGYQRYWTQSRQSRRPGGFPNCARRSDGPQSVRARLGRPRPPGGSGQGHAGHSPGLYRQW